MRYDMMVVLLLLCHIHHIKLESVYMILLIYILIFSVFHSSCFILYIYHMVRYHIPSHLVYLEKLVDCFVCIYPDSHIHGLIEYEFQKTLIFALFGVECRILLYLLCLGWFLVDDGVMSYYWFILCCYHTT